MWKWLWNWVVGIGWKSLKYMLEKANIALKRLDGTCPPMPDTRASIAGQT